MTDSRRLLWQQHAEGSGADGQTREAVVSLLVDEGPMTASDIAERLGISAAGVRRHLDNLTDGGDVELAPAGFSKGGRGRPAKWFQLSPAGRGKLRHAYDDLAGAAMRSLRDVAGQGAVEKFARERVDGLVAGVTPVAESGSVIATVEQIASALTGAGYSADVREVGSGVQMCQHHCPVAHVAAEFPELCEAETAVFTELLGTHVQRLATIANGDCVCSTHVPVHRPADLPEPDAPKPDSSEPGTSRPHSTLDPKATSQPLVADNPDGKVPR
ncbi:transcriptional regulator [Gordonia sp. HY002]|uniref:helix-turn-helix transcriptional regulator n=1 Tax=Gordonia zhenghanii TaxID=2911516 RepID=UPI001EF098B5|nr:metalloregulator ArsR/SmtB family transcription factor [Gordonia zhenghanii]MCF8569799.1 transcriptional regulator [Gordonia zhenghanii]MCF8606698.1 transcriptional regulator [Gordonia zhenghanii]